MCPITWTLCTTVHGEHVPIEGREKEREWKTRHAEPSVAFHFLYVDCMCPCVCDIAVDIQTTVHFSFVPNDCCEPICIHNEAAMTWTLLKVSTTKNIRDIVVCMVVQVVQADEERLSLSTCHNALIAWKVLWLKGVSSNMHLFFGFQPGRLGQPLKRKPHWISTINNVPRIRPKKWRHKRNLFILKSTIIVITIIDFSVHVISEQETRKFAAFRQHMGTCVNKRCAAFIRSVRKL